MLLVCAVACIPDDVSKCLAYKNVTRGHLSKIARVKKQ